MNATVNVDTCSEITSICQLKDTIYGYYPSVPSNSFFLSLFSILSLSNIYLGLRFGTWTYALALTCGCLVEAIGYIGRLILHDNPFSDLGFKIQICCLIMGPAWLAMGIYLTLKHVVKAYGRQHSYLRPKYYTWLFIGGDFFSLSLQAAGGGLSSGADGDMSQLTAGNNLAITGIILQVVTLAIFAALAALFFVRRHLSLRNPPQKLFPYPETPQTPQTLRFNFFLAAVALAFITIFTRCVYRIAEMMGGWGNPLMQNQGEFIALDSVMCGIAALALTVFHPGWCFPQMAQAISLGKGKVLGTLQDPELAKSDSGSETDLDLEAAKTGKMDALYSNASRLANGNVR